MECDQHRHQISLAKLKNQVEELNQKIIEEKKVNVDIEEYLKGHYKVRSIPYLVHFVLKKSIGFGRKN